MSQFALADNVKETTTTTLTGTVSLLGAFNTSSKTFVNGIGSGKLTAYKIDDGAGNWECRYGVITSGSPDTITNAGFISSSTGSAVSFGAGTKTVTCVPMSELFLTAAISPVLVETDIASATTTDLGSIQTLRARITGTTTITGFGTSPNTMRFVRFAGALTLTHDGTSLILPGAANIATAAGDIALFVSDGSGNWRCLWYQRGAAAPNAPTRQVLTSGSGATYTTPAGVRQLRLRLVGGGGGSGGTGSGFGNGGTGGNTIFNSINAAGGGGSAGGDTGNNAIAGAGGTGGSGSASFRTPGSAGCAGQAAGANGGFGGSGGASPLGGGGKGGSGAVAAAANTGGGASGTNCGTTNLATGGGGAGEYVELIINSPTATYTYTIGAAGAAGAGATGGAAGGTGLIIVDEIY